MSAKKKTTPAFDMMIDHVLAYKPKAQFVAQKKRAQKSKQVQREKSSI